MDQIKANYERVILMAAGLLLLAVALYTALGLSSVQEEFPAPDVRSSGEAFEPDAALAGLQAEAAKVHDASGTVWSEQASSLFVSRRYLLSEGNLIDIEESGTQLVPGIDNDWILKHDLDYTDRNLAEADADGSVDDVHRDLLRQTTTRTSTPATAAIVPSSESSPSTT